MESEAELNPNLEIMWFNKYLASPVFFLGNISTEYLVSHSGSFRGPFRIRSGKKIENQKTCIGHSKTFIGRWERGTAMACVWMSGLRGHRKPTQYKESQLNFFIQTFLAWGEIVHALGSCLPTCLSVCALLAYPYAHRVCIPGFRR